MQKKEQKKYLTILKPRTKVEQNNRKGDIC